MSLTKDKKTGIIKEYQSKKADTGSCQVQIALLTQRINDLTQHLQTSGKDKHSRVGLIKMVERRKKLLSYLARENEEQYKKLIARLDLRK